MKKHARSSKNFSVLLRAFQLQNLPLFKGRITECVAISKERV